MVGTLKDGSGNVDNDSSLSDDEDGLLSPEDDSHNEIRMKPRSTTKESVKSLFYNTDKVCQKHFAFTAWPK